MVIRRNQAAFIVLSLLGVIFIDGAFRQQAKAEESLRLLRPVAQSNPITGMSPGYAQRWLRNLGNPSFCRMELCHGSCADPIRSVYDPSIVGTPSLYSEHSGGPTWITPCGLRTFHHLLDSQPHSCSM
jgi:hypothetical protein